ncbi:Carbohydrate sulfotransferase 8 [Takifugu flavidus]|uniref:Carbohydrate sulfotransferase n=1 Tax=Takifugu flavidus TaxID=433684 RepID=A0A5C6P8R7_9TELE|nr:Carbohydrate sulfotransferase 8 [Takifugu flavidus]
MRFGSQVTSQREKLNCLRLPQGAPWWRVWVKPAGLCLHCGASVVMKRSGSLLRSVWFLVVLGAASVLLLFHLQGVSDPVQHQRPGVHALRALKSPVEQKQKRGVLVPGENAELTAAANVSSASPVQTFEASSRKAGRLERLAKMQESRRHLLTQICARFQPGVRARSLTQWHLSRLYVEDRYKLLYCEVPKAGCSNWKRVLMVLSGSAVSTRDIPHDTAHYANSLRQLKSYGRTGVAQRLRSYTKVLFVREPFERLVSAFRDKFESPNAYYHSVFGRPIITKEFVRYLLDVQRPVKMDIHWEPVSQLCSPCVFGYNFVGRFERLQEEASFLLRSIGAPRNLTFPNFKDRNPGAERTSPSITQRYFAQLSAAERQRVFDFYYMDYLMFNYSKPFDDLH